MSPYSVKVGDLEPALEVEVLSAGRPLDVSAAVGVVFVISPTGATSPTVEAAGEILDTGTTATRGRCRYVWATGDTATAGTYEVEVRIEWSAGREQTFPGDGTLALVIEERLPSLIP